MDLWKLKITGLSHFDWALEQFVKGFSVWDIFPVDVSLHFLLYQTPILRHFLCRQCKQRSLKVQWCIFVIINSSAALWMTQSSVSSVWHKLCLCSSSKSGFLLKLSTWLWRLSTVNYESILQGWLIQYWWLAHFIVNLCPDDLSHWVGDSTIRVIAQMSRRHFPFPINLSWVFIRPKEICNLLYSFLRTSVNPDKSNTNKQIW